MAAKLPGIDVSIGQSLYIRNGLLEFELYEQTLSSDVKLILDSLESLGHL
jgi:hypothetical protein